MRTSSGETSSVLGVHATLRAQGERGEPADRSTTFQPVTGGGEQRSGGTLLVAAYDHDHSQHDFLLGYRWDIVLTGSQATLMERPGDHHA